MVNPPLRVSLHRSLVIPVAKLARAFQSFIAFITNHEQRNRHTASETWEFELAIVVLASRTQFLAER